MCLCVSVSVCKGGGGGVGGKFFSSWWGNFFKASSFFILFCFSDLDTSPLEISFPCKGR